MEPAKLTLDPFTEGDGWKGIPALSIKVNGVTPAAAISSAEMLFAKNNNTQPNPAIELSSANNKLTIVSAANWEISVPPQVVPGLTEGEWLFQIKITPVGGLPETYVSDVLTVLKTVRKTA